MISTRVHGAIDYAAAALFGRLSLSPALPIAVRTVFGAAGTYHAAYSMLTDYEAGLRPMLTMPQHLMLDGVGAGVLLAYGLKMRRQGTLPRILVLAAGAAEIVIIVRSSAVARSGPGSGTGLAGRMLGLDALSDNQVSEPPLDALKPAAPDLFIVDSIMSGPLGLKLPVRMTVIRLANGELLLHSPTRFSPGLQEALANLGRVRHLIAPNIVHWTFLKQWQNAYPDAITWAAPNLRTRPQVRRSGVRIDRDLSELSPPGWDGIELIIVPGGVGFREVALFHRPSRTLLLTDLVLNLQWGQVPPALRTPAKWLDIVEAGGRPPIYLRTIFNLRRRAAAEAARRLIALQPDRVLFAHGPWFKDHGTDALRNALHWITG